MELCPQTNYSSVQNLQNDNQFLERKSNFSGQKIMMLWSTILQIIFFTEFLVLTYFFGFNGLVFLSNGICYFVFLSKQDDGDIMDNNN